MNSALSGRSAYGVVAAISLFATVLIGLGHLHFPFTGDQALFSVFGQMIDDGAVLYQDIWDVKQPGIFIFFWMAGRLFGFTEVGAHSLELLDLVSFSLVIMRLLANRYQTKWLAGLCPLVIVGWYYAVAPMSYLTQIEALVGPPLFLTAYLVWKGGAVRFFSAGVLAGLVLLTKAALIPLVVVLCFVAARQSAHPAKARDWLISFAGGLLVAGIPFLVFTVANGLTERVWWTFVTYPPQVLPLSGRTTGRLIRAIGGFVVRFLPLLTLAAIGMKARWQDPLARIWGAWVAAGLATYLLQLWWGYLLLLLVVPVGLLALDGLDELLRWRRAGSRAAITLVLVIGVVPALVILGSKAMDLARNGLGLGDRQTEYHDAVSNQYRTIRADVAQFDAEGVDSLYVLGNPLYLYLSGTPQALPNTGWSPEFWTDRLWSEFEAGLQEERPALLLVDSFSARLAEDRSPQTLDLVDALYSPLRPSSRAGTWYTLRDEADP